jgi:hypothetical protein
LNYLKNLIQIFFLLKLQNGWIIQNGADHYNFCSWTMTFVFFNRFENQNMFWKHIFISYSFSLVWWFSFSKWWKYSRWRFTDFLCFSSNSGVLNCKLLKLLFQNMIYWISISKWFKQNFNKITRWRINSRWRVVLKFCSLLYSLCSFELIFKSEYILEMSWDDLWNFICLTFQNGGQSKMAPSSTFYFWLIVFAFFNRFPWMNTFWKCLEMM